MTPLETDEALRRAVRARLDRLTKPQGSLGRLEDLVAF
jgi:NaMN:DMB phosphoribosyltransferase